MNNWIWVYNSWRSGIYKKYTKNKRYSTAIIDYFKNEYDNDIKWIYSNNMNLSEPMEPNDDKTIDLLVHKSKLIKNI